MTSNIIHVHILVSSSCTEFVDTWLPHVTLTDSLQLLILRSDVIFLKSMSVDSWEIFVTTAENWLVFDTHSGTGSLVPGQVIWTEPTRQ